MRHRLSKVLAVVLSFLMIATTFSYAAGSDQFADVESGSWYVPYVDFVVDNGYMNGTGKTTFEPNSNLTRAMFATILARYDGASVDDSKKTAFSDVEVNQWFTGSIGWANEKGIVNGTGNGKFSPSTDITRQDLCVMVERYIDYVEKNTPKEHVTPGEKTTFTDASEIADYAKDAVDKAIIHGLVTGYPDGTFKPQNKITRAETAAIISRIKWKEDAGDTWKITTYDADGKATVTEVKKGETFAVPRTQPREGYNFVGWNTQKDGKGTAYKPGQKITPTGDMSLYPQYEAADIGGGGGGGGGGEAPVNPPAGDTVEKFNVKVYYGLNDEPGKVREIEVEVTNGKFVFPEYSKIPEIAEEAGDTVDIRGYSIRENSGQPGTAIYAPKSSTTNKTLVDKIKANGLSVQYANQLSGDVYYTVNFIITNNDIELKGDEPKPEKVAKGNTVPKPVDPEALPPEDGVAWVFVGWVTADGNPYDFSTPVTNNLDLFAVWEEDFSVDFDSSGTNADMPAGQVVPGGKTIDKPQDPELEGYRFEGWYYDEELTQPVTFPVTVEENTVFHAKWKKIKFQLTAESGAKVQGTVFADYAAELMIEKGKVNSKNVTLKADMWDVASLNSMGHKSHSITVDTKLDDREYELLSYLKQAEAFKSANVTANYRNGAKDAEVLNTVTYELKGDKDDDGNVIITGTPDEDQARATWQAIVNDTHMESGSKAEDDSYINIANGSWLQVGTDLLKFEDGVAADLKLDNFGNLDAAIQSVKDSVQLVTGQGTDDETISFVLKKGTELAVGSSHVVLKEDAHVKITGLALNSNDPDNPYSVLEDLRTAANGGKKELVRKAVMILDNAIGAADGKDITVDIWFTESKPEPTPKFQLAVSSGAEVKGTVYSDYSAELYVPNANVNSGNLTISADMWDVASLNAMGHKSHSVTIDTRLDDQEYNLMRYLGNVASFDSCTVKASYGDKAVTYELAGSKDDDGNVTITGTTDEDQARAMWQALVSSENISSGSKDADDSYINIANGSWLRIGQDTLEFEEGASDLKLDGFNNLDSMIQTVKNMVKLTIDENVDDETIEFVLKAGTELAVSNSYAKLEKDAYVKITGLALNGEGTSLLTELQKAANSQTDAKKALVKAAILQLNNAIGAADGQTINVMIEFR